MSKPGPKNNLLPGQEDNINKMFYRDFMLEYFDEKVILLVDLLGNSKEYVERLIDKELSIDSLKFESDDTGDPKKIEKFAKCELIDTYYHCLETFMRLFIAHASFESCPLIELTALDTHGYHKILNQIADGNFNSLNDKFNGDDTILLVLIGNKKNSNLVNDKQLNNLKSWIVFCAKELQKMNEYNSFKHGLSMFAGFGSMKITNPSDGKIVLEKEGDAIHVLESKETETQYKFSLTSIFVEYDFKVALIFFYNELIKNIIQVGNYRYVTNDKNTKINSFRFTEFNYFELRDTFYKRGDLGSLLNSYGTPLFYEDDIEESE